MATGVLKSGGNLKIIDYAPGPIAHRFVEKEPGELPKVKEPYRLVRAINSKHVHNMDVKELEVAGYYGNQEILHFSTYIWQGIPATNKER